MTDGNFVVTWRQLQRGEQIFMKSRKNTQNGLRNL